MTRWRIVVGLALLALLAGAVVRLMAPGPLLRTVPVGAYPVAVAVDEQTGRAFVVNGGGGSVSVLDATR